MDNINLSNNYGMNLEEQQRQQQLEKQNSHDKVNMDAILQANVGEISNEMTVTFKKTVLIRSYETEVIEAVNSVKFDRSVSGMERMFVHALIEAQIEYMAYHNLLGKGLITMSQFAERKEVLEHNIYELKQKAEAVLGTGVIDKYLKDEFSGS